MRHQGAAGVLADGDAAAHLLHGRLADVVAGRHDAGPVVGRVPGRDERAAGHPQGQDRQARGHRLVDVHDVEVPVAHPRADPPRRLDAEAQARDRPVVADRHRPTAVHDPRRQLGGVLHGCEHAHLVPVIAQCHREVGDVGAHPAGDVPRVRADETDLHVPASALAASDARRRPGSRSAVHTGCIMCQSTLWSLMPASNAVATPWTTARTRSSRVPDSGIGIGVVHAPGGQGPVVPEAHRDDRGTGEHAEDRRAGGEGRGLAEQVDDHPVAPDVPVAHERHQPSLPDPTRQGADDVGLAGRQDLHAERLAVLQEALVQALRLQPFRDGREAAVPQAAPGAGQVPVAAVVDHHDRPGAARHRVVHHVLALEVEARA